MFMSDAGPVANAVHAVPRRLARPQVSIRAVRRLQSRRALIATYFLLAVGVPLLYVGITHHVWEDFFITFRHSVNFVEGRGLTFNPPQRVQGFTSAINVMLPALFYWMTGQHGYEAALQLFLAASLGALVVGGWTTLRWMRLDRGGDRLSPLLFILLFVTEAKTIAYSMNGQESGFMVGFLSLMFACAYRGLSQDWGMMGLIWAGLLYTRPDAPIFIAAMAIVCLVFRRNESETALLGSIIKAGLIAAAVYFPWFVSMWAYYGNPIPHTIIAKSGFGSLNFMYPEKLLVKWLAMFPRHAMAVFLPLYSDFGGWPQWLVMPFGAVCATVSSIYWLIPSRDRAGRMASLMFVLIVGYLNTVALSGTVFPWYLPSAAVFGVIVLARAMAPLLRRFGPRRLVLPMRLAQAAIVLVAGLLLAGTMWQIRIQQREIEFGVRQQIGLYLRDVVPPGERVYLEPLGYIGYFSNAHILDWPGLVSPEVERLHHQRRLGQLNMIRALKPEWLVLREGEYRGASRFQEVQEHYQVVRSFNARQRLASYGYFPGSGYPGVDAVFYVLHRTPPSGEVH
jgi:hypothetical protein